MQEWRFLDDVFRVRVRCCWSSGCGRGFLEVMSFWGSLVVLERGWGQIVGQERRTNSAQMKREIYVLWRHKPMIVVFDDFFEPGYLSSTAFLPSVSLFQL